MRWKDLAKGDIETPLPIRKALLDSKIYESTPVKLPNRVFPWRRMVVISLAGFVIGNSLVTIALYWSGVPELTAWTGHVSQSTPSAVNDLCLGIINLVLALYLLRKT